MDTTIDNIQLKRAWQTAFELRLCPGGDILFTSTPDENLKKHLEICHVCREKREMPLEQRAAWEALQRQFAGEMPRPAKPQPVGGQVWSLKKSLAGWGKDGYFYRPPMILLLEKIEGSRGFKAVQIYGDRLLMGEGDVWLENDWFGFAQGWNCFALHEEALDGCWGAVSDKVLEQVHEAVTMTHAPVEEDSIIHFFRSMEINVGARVALPSVAVLVEEWESKFSENESFLGSIFGSLAEVYRNLSHLKLPKYANSLLDLLYGARDPHAITPVVASTSYSFKVNVIIKQIDGAMSIKTVGATLTENNWDDGDYYVAGKLDQVVNEELFLVASINANGKAICEHQSRIEKQSPYFDIVFKSVPKEVCSIKHLRLILVKP